MELLNVDNMAATVTTTSARVKAAKKVARGLKNSKQKPVHIIFILDRSSSMQSMREEAIQGFNTFLSTQQELPGKADLSFVYFDTDVTLMYDRADVKKVPQLNFATYVPSGMTALYDAIGYTFDRFKTSTVYDKTIVAILTDGQENASRKYNATSVRSIIKDVQDEAGWEVMFLGANLDSKQFAQDVGMKLNNVTDYEYTKKGMLDSINTMAYATSAMRGMKLDIGGQAMAAANLDMNTLYNLVKDGKEVKATVDESTPDTPDAV